MWDWRPMEEVEGFFIMWDKKCWTWELIQYGVHSVSCKLSFTN